MKWLTFFTMYILHLSVTLFSLSGRYIRFFWHLLRDLITIYFILKHREPKRRRFPDFLLWIALKWNSSAAAKTNFQFSGLRSVSFVSPFSVAVLFRFLCVVFIRRSQCNTALYLESSRIKCEANLLLYNKYKWNLLKEGDQLGKLYFIGSK